MLKILKRQRLIIMAALLLIPAIAAGYEEVEDLVELVVTDNNFVAVVDGRQSFSEDISSGERVLWQGAKGEVGAFLTSQRLLAAGITSGQWNALNLKSNEKRTEPEMLLAAHLVVMLTSERIVIFGTRTGGFFQTRLPLRESVVAKSAEGRVAAVVTSGHAFGYSSFRRGVSDFRFRREETLVSLKTTYNKITLQTTERLVSLDAEDAVWREFELR